MNRRRFLATVVAAPLAAACSSPPGPDMAAFRADLSAFDMLWSDILPGTNLPAEYLERFRADLVAAVGVPERRLFKYSGLDLRRPGVRVSFRE